MLAGLSCKASRATPVKPISKPRLRRRVMRSPNQAQATTAPNKGVDALSTEAMPVGMCTTAYENSENGMAELMIPEKSTGFQCLRRAGHSARHSITGIKNSAAMPTRMPAVGTAPKADAPRRINKKLAPHSTASKINSGSQRRLLLALLATGATGVAVAVLAACEGVEALRMVWIVMALRHASVRGLHHW